MAAVMTRSYSKDSATNRRNSFGKAEAAPELAAHAARFREDIDAIMRRHRHEVDVCFDTWIGSIRGLLQEPKVTLESPELFSGDTEFVTTLPGMVNSHELVHIMPTAMSRETMPPAIPDVKMGGSRRRTNVPHAFVTQKKKAEAMERHTLFERCVYSRGFEWFSFTIIILNCMFIGVETQFNARQAEDHARNNMPQDSIREPLVFWVLQALFCVVFIVELGLRWMCAGFVEFFKTVDILWNIFDVFVVTLGLFDVIIKGIILQAGSTVSSGVLLGNITVFRVLRIIRVIRVLKVIRVMRFFRELRMMIAGILKSTKSMIWVMVVFGMLFYMFGIFFTNATTSYLTTSMRRSSEYQELLTSFGTLDTSILSLFMAMSGGNDWNVYYGALMKLPGLFTFVFVFFILLSVFVVTNVVIGIFVETAMQSNRDDREACINDELEVKKSYLNSMRQVFNEIKNDDSDTIGLEEFEERLQDERIQAYFSALKLDVSDARTLFTLLDYDRSCEVSLEEFIAGCYSLQGESKNLDMKIMQCETKALLERVYCVEDRLNCLTNYVYLRSGSARASRKVSAT